MIHDEKLFIDDISRPEMLHVLPVTASIPRGKIKKILSPDFPDGYGILGPDDIPGKREMEVMGDTVPFFSGDEIDYEGQTIRLLYGPNPREVKKLREKVRIEYETDFTLLGFRDYKPEQIMKEKRVSRGKPPRKSSKTEIITGEYETAFHPRGHNTFTGGFAAENGKGFLIRGASQWPYLMRATVAGGLGMDPKKIVFQGTAGTIGGDGPVWYPGILMFHAALASVHTKKPCRILLKAGESLLNKNDHSPAIFRYETTIDPDGRVMSRKINVDIDAGSNPILSDELLDRLCISVMGSYPTGYVETTVRLIETSGPPLDNFNGLGMAQGFFAAEMNENSLAKAVSADPLERRKKWCLSQGKPFLTGGIYGKKMKPEDLLERTGELSDFKRKYAAYQLRNSSKGRLFPINPRRGIGISLAFQGNGFISIPPGKFSVSVKLDKEEEVSIRTSSVPAFPRTKEIWKNTAAAILQIDPSQVAVENLDTAKVPDSGPSLFSNNITVIPRLIEQCCQSIQKKRFRAPLPIEIKRTFRFPAGSSWNRETFQGQPFISMSWSATAVEVEMNPVSFIPELRGIWMTVDCGRIMDKNYARSVIESSIYRTYSYCINRGSHTAGPDEFPQDCSSCSMKSPLPIRIEFTESRESQPGGIGSLAENTIPSAFLSAVNQAAGKNILRLPLMAADLLNIREIEE